MIGAFVELWPARSKVAKYPIGYVLDGDGCWTWTGSRNNSGYGSVVVDGETVGAHRFMYEREHGPIPSGMQVHHECRNRLCVNPSHLRLVHPLEHPDAVGTINAAKTHCNHGHPFDETNTYYLKTATSVERVCRECSRRNALRWYHGQPHELWNALKTHCDHGHEFTPANTYFWHTPKGLVQRKCRMCNMLRQREYVRRRRDREGASTLT